MRVVCIGELVMDFIEGKPFTGGGPAHVAIHLHQSGVDTRLYTCLGKDRDGKYLLDYLARIGMDTRGVQWTEKVPTRHLRIQFEPDGGLDLHIPVRDTAEQYLRWQDEMAAEVQSADIVHIGGTALLGEQTRKTTLAVIDVARRVGTRLAFDPNIRLHRQTGPAHKAIAQLVDQADYFKLNEREWQQVFGQREIREVASTKRQLLVRTLGAGGAELAFGEGYHFEPAPICQVKNALGAGDAFWSAILFGILNTNREKDITEAVLAQLGAGGAHWTKRVLGSTGGLPE